MEAFAKDDRKRKIKEYTHYLKYYAEFDVFEPILEDGNRNSKDFKGNNVFWRKNLTHCILKSIMGAIYQKKYEKGGKLILWKVFEMGVTRKKSLNFSMNCCLNFQRPR